MAEPVAKGEDSKEETNGGRDAGREALKMVELASATEAALSAAEHAEGGIPVLPGVNCKLLFVAAARVGATRVMKALIAPAQSKRAVSQSLAERALACACCYGQQAAAKLICEHYKVDGSCYLRCLCRAAIGGHLEVARWLLEQFAHRPFQAWEPIIIALAYGNSDFADALAQHSKVSPRDMAVLGKRAFLLACAIGDLARAKRLAETFAALPADALTSHEGKAFVEACHAGELDVVQWICVEAKTPSKAGAPLWNKAIFSGFATACSCGREAVARWLADFFALAVDAAAREKALKYTLASNLNCGQYPICVWLLRSGVSTEPKAIQSYFRKACKGGNVEIYGLLVSTFGEPAEDTVFDLFEGACFHDHLELAAMLARRWEITKAQVEGSRLLMYLVGLASPSCPKELRSLRMGDGRLWKWLAETYGFPAGPAHTKQEDVEILYALCAPPAGSERRVLDPSWLYDYLTPREPRGTSCRKIVPLLGVLGAALALAWYAKAC